MVGSQLKIGKITVTLKSWRPIFPFSLRLPILGTKARMANCLPFLLGFHVAGLANQVKDTVKAWSPYLFYVAFLGLFFLIYIGRGSLEK